MPPFITFLTRLVKENGSFFAPSGLEVDVNVQIDIEGKRALNVGLRCIVVPATLVIIALGTSGRWTPA